MDRQQQEESGLHFLDYWRVIRSRKEIILAVALLVILTGTAVTFMMDAQYRSTCRIIVKKDNTDIDVFRQQSVAGFDLTFLATEYEIIRSKKILYKVIDNLNLQAIWGKKYTKDESQLSKKFCYDILKKRVVLDQVRNTSTIAINAISTDKDEAARIANEVATVYREERLTYKIREVKRSIEALETEMQKQSDKVAQAEEDVEEVRQKHDIVDAGWNSPSRQQLSELQGNLINYKVDSLARKARLEALENLDGQELVDAGGLIVYDATVQSIRKQLMDSKLSRTFMLQDLGKQHPDVLQLNAGIEELEVRLDGSLQGLKTGLRADYQVALAKQEALQAELDRARNEEIRIARFDRLPYEKAQRTLRIQRSILDSLQAKIATEGIGIQMPRSPVEIFEPAEPAGRPFSPNLLLNILLSIFVGLVAGIGLAYFIEYLDTSVKTVDEIEAYLDLKVIGVIPQKVKPLIHEGPDSPHAEAYRVLRTNIQFTRGASGGAFCVVSGGVGEGKSTTLFNLAYICAQMGDKVLIVDSDLRRPVQHTILDMSNRFGLTNVLLRDVPLEETIKTTSEPNLHFLPSGKLPRTSIGLLDTQRVRDLIKNLKARYDYVFFDSPPIMGVSDASIIASEVDGVLLVVQYRKYPRVMSARAKRLVEGVGGNIIGVVLNNINVLKDDYYYYYHSYYSHYAHGVDDAEPVKEMAAAEHAEERF
ncbi:MAG: succinoglycan biosynthesis transport protein ExoP [Verrucomicrobiales bacterium]|jgi:succinoglycan biosynthesis transport protein ExoP